MAKLRQSVLLDLTNKFVVGELRLAVDKETCDTKAYERRAGDR